MRKPLWWRVVQSAGKAHARWSLWIVLIVASGTLCAQQLQENQQPQEGWLHADFRNEYTHRIPEACGKFSFKSIPGCGYELFTDHPLHFTAGSLPPQNGLGLGLAFVAARNTKNWRNDFDLDAVGTTSGNWRMGGYLSLVHTPARPIKVIHHKPGEPVTHKKPHLGVHPFTEINLYAQAISLNKVNYFGLGNTTSLSGASLFGMRQTIVGASAIKPIFDPSISWMKLSFFGEANGRFVSIRPSRSTTVPSIGTLYTNATAPGLSNQPAFIQFAQGFRINPVLKDRLEFDYRAGIQEFIAPSNSQYSFARWALDLNHTFHIWGYEKSAPAGVSGGGPDSCAAAGDKCSNIPVTVNRSGFVGARLFISESLTSATSIPFYFQQTLGGSDINNQMALGSYQDYRFRAPNLLLAQAYVEHSVWGPFGLKFMADEGRVALTRGDLGFSHLRHSFAAGLTLRAGGFPMVQMMFAWGGSEGHHNIFNMNSSLLGGGSRPSLD